MRWRADDRTRSPLDNRIVSFAAEEAMSGPPGRAARHRLTWVGHSTVLLEVDGLRLLTDPVLRPRVLHLQRVGSALRLDEHGPDVVLISHVHYDHLDLASLRLLGGSPRFVVPRGAGRLLRSRGFDDIVEVAPGDEEQIRGITIRATHAEHDSRRGPFGIETPALGYLVTGPASTYFAGDTDLFAGMNSIADDLDVALLPVAGWGPRLPPGHLNPRTAAEALALLRPRIAVPIHWGTYRRLGLTRDPLKVREPAESFARFAAELTPEVEVRIVPVGGSLDLKSGATVERSGGER
jgi:L-ascorbate metabolism protein UlaG (beta-lactamase superfamily)